MTQPRELWVTYHGTTEPELFVDGFLTDAATLTLFGTLYAREVDAWTMSIVGQLPDWWRRVDLVEARNLTGPLDPDKPNVGRPGDEAAKLWETATVKDRISMQKGWRVYRGSAGGHQIDRRAVDTRRIVSAPVQDLDPLETGEVSVEPVRIPRPQQTSGLIIPERRLIRL